MNVTFATRSNQGAQDSAGEEFRRKNRFKQVKFTIYLVSFELILLCIFFRFSTYAISADASVPENGISVALGGGASRTEASQIIKNITLLVIVTALLKGNTCSLMQIRNHAAGGQILHLLVVGLGFQMALLSRGFFFMVYKGMEDIRLDVHDISEAMMAVLALSLTSMFIIGKTSGIHLLLLITLFIPLYTVTKLVNEEIILVTDPGNALTVHLFGTLFGGVVHFLVQRSKLPLGSELCPHQGNKETDVWTTFGPITLFIAFPIINAIEAESDADMSRAIINTIMAQISGLVASLAIMVAKCHIKEIPYDVHILQGSFVCGGVSIASSATLMTQPAGAMVIGLISGLVSSFTYAMVELSVQNRYRLPCSNGLLSFHGITSVLGGIAAAIMASISEDRDGTISYYNSLYPLYPARVPNMATCKSLSCSYTFGEIISNYPFLEDKALSRTAHKQALFQLLGIALAVVIAVLGGLVTGFMIRVSAARCGNDYPNLAWNDESYLLNKCDRQSRRQSLSTRRSNEDS